MVLPGASKLKGMFSACRKYQETNLSQELKWNAKTWITMRSALKFWDLAICKCSRGIGGWQPGMQIYSWSPHTSVRSNSPEACYKRGRISFWGGGRRRRLWNTPVDGKSVSKSIKWNAGTVWTDITTQHQQWTYSFGVVGLQVNDVVLWEGSPCFTEQVSIFIKTLPHTRLCNKWHFNSFKSNLNGQKQLRLSCTCWLIV